MPSAKSVIPDSDDDDYDYGGVEVPDDSSDSDSDGEMARAVQTLRQGPAGARRAPEPERQADSQRCFVLRREYPGSFGVNISKDARIIGVTEGGPAQRAGLAAGQQIVGLGGERVASYEDVVRVLQGTPPDAEVQFVVRDETTRPAASAAAAAAAPDESTDEDEAQGRGRFSTAVDDHQPEDPAPVFKKIFVHLMRNQLSAGKVLEGAQTDASGKLSLGELRAALGRVGLSLGEEEFALVIREVGVGADAVSKHGFVNRINTTAEEVLARLKQSKRPEPPKGPASSAAGAAGTTDGGGAGAGAGAAEHSAAITVLPEPAQCDAVFKRFDSNGNGLLSLAEIDKAVLELYPQFNHKAAIMRAYNAADTSGDGWVGRREFDMLLRYLGFFSRLWEQFEAMDVQPRPYNHDKRLSLDEFRRGALLVLGEDETLDAAVRAAPQFPHMRVHARGP